MSYEITKAAERDIKDILTRTLKTFGSVQLEFYANVIGVGVAMVGDDPVRGGAIDRSEIAPGVKLFHLQLAAGRIGAAAHCLYYTTGKMSDGSVGTIILRVLHERMEPRHRIVRSLSDHVRPQSDDPPEPPSP